MDNPADNRAGGLSVAELRRWMVLIGALAYWGNVVRTARHEGATGLGYVLEGLLQNGAFAAAAWVLIAGWSAGAGPARRTSAGQLVASLALCLLGIVPSRQTAILMLLALGGQLIADPRGTPAGRRIAALLLALAFDMAWTSPYLLPLHAAVATLDARAVQMLLHVAGHDVRAYGNLVAGATPGFGIEILARCASSYPLGGVCLGFAVTTLYLGRSFDWRLLPWLAASLLAGIVLSELRLSWMTLREADFHWLHEGGGVTLYTLAAMSLAVLFPVLAARRAGDAAS